MERTNLDPTDEQILKYFYSKTIRKGVSKRRATIIEKYREECRKSMLNEEAKLPTIEQVQALFKTDSNIKSA